LHGYYLCNVCGDLLFEDEKMTPILYFVAGIGFYIILRYIFADDIPQEQSHAVDEADVGNSHNCPSDNGNRESYPSN